MAKRPKEVQAAINKGKAAWKKARETKPGASDFSAPKLKKYGTHKVKFDAKYGLTKNEDLYASLTWTILDGADKNKSHNKFYGIQGEDEEKAQKAMGRLAADVQVLTGQDTSEADFSDPSSLFDLLDEIHKDSPIAMVDLKEDGDFLNCFIKELVDDDDSDDEEDEEDEDSEEEEEEEDEEEKPKRGRKPVEKKAPAKSSKSSKSKKDEDEEDEEDDDEVEEEDEEEDEDVQEPEKGDVVMYKPPRAKKAIACTVKTVNKRAGTCSLQEEDGTKKFADVEWDKLEY